MALDSKQINKRQLIIYRGRKNMSIIMEYNWTKRVREDSFLLRKESSLTLRPYNYYIYTVDSR